CAAQTGHRPLCGEVIAEEGVRKMICLSLSRLLITAAALLLVAHLSPALAERSERIFNGRDLAGWEGNPAYWSVQDGMIVGKLDSAKVSTYLVTKKRYRNFRLIVTVKEVVRNAHSGIAY